MLHLDVVSPLCLCGLGVQIGVKFLLIKIQLQ